MADKEDASFLDRARFMAYAARVMRGLIIDHARRQQAQKRCGQFEITSFGTEVEGVVDHQDLTRIGQA